MRAREFHLLRSGCHNAASVASTEAWAAAGCGGGNRDPEGQFCGLSTRKSEAPLDSVPNCPGLGGLRYWRAQRVTLNPGDVLVMPKGWIHAVATEGPRWAAFLELLDPRM